MANSAPPAPAPSGLTRRPHYLRRTLIVNRRLQYAVLFYSVFVAAAATALSTAFFQLAVFRQYSDDSSWNREIAVCVFAVLLIFGSIFWFGLVLTNRIAGPIYRLKKHMESVVAGESPKPLSFRKGDLFTEVLEPYNALVQLTEKPKS